MPVHDAAWHIAKAEKLALKSGRDDYNGSQAKAQRSIAHALIAALLIQQEKKA